MKRLHWMKGRGLVLAVACACTAKLPGGGEVRARRPRRNRAPLAAILMTSALAATTGTGSAADGSASVPTAVDAATPLVAGGGTRAFAPYPGSNPNVHSTAVRTAGTLSLRAALAVKSLTASRRLGEDCAPGTPASFECFDVTGGGTVRGLGRVSLTMLHFVDTAPPGCPSGSFAVPGASVRLSVAGKGTIELRLDAATGCRTLGTVLSHTRSFTVSDGTGAYSGATGTGSVRRVAGFADRGAKGKDFIAGTLSVPELDFDLAPPTIIGATARTVRASRGAATARVSYSVRAVDARDGVVPVRCKPVSGAAFRIGRTRVSCTATDKSGNSRVALFWVTVRPTR